MTASHALHFIPPDHRRGHVGINQRFPKNHVKILLREIAQENWGVRGGQAGCDIELGFKVEV